MKSKLTLVLLLLLLPLNLFALTWEEVKPAVVTGVTIEDKTVTINFSLETGSNGADKGKLYLLNSSKAEVETRAIGRSKKTERSMSFELEKSDTYTVIVESEKKGETTKKTSLPYTFSFTLPLDVTEPKVKNLGKGQLEVTFSQVAEAEYYIVTRQASTTEKQLTRLVSPIVFSNLTVGSKQKITLSAVRKGEIVSSIPIEKTVRAEAERDWNFTAFGQSSKKDSLNYMKMLDSDNLKFQLISCLYDLATGTTLEKGGKFTTFHDGISYYYTQYDPKTENFELSATITVDYINPMPDGQEGFGILAMDSLGYDGSNMVNHYTNSAGIIATKFEETINGSKKTSKDTLGSRFVTGLTSQIINGGDELIAQNGKNVSHAFSYDSSDLIKTGDVYRITLKKDNTGYHAIYKKAIKAEESVEEFTLYGSDKLEEIDSNYSYVGFAVARGCNITVSDVEMIITDPRTDPIALKEPDELIPLITKIDSPTTYGEDSYPFVFYANSKGWLTVKDKEGKVLVNNTLINPNEDFKTQFTIKKGFNDYFVTFTPDKNYKPGLNQTLAQYDSLNKVYKENYSATTSMFSVIYLNFDTTTLYVSPSGSIFGKGTYNDPLDIDSALLYATPGQTIVLKQGSYYPSRQIIVERGNSGYPNKVKTLTTENGEQVVIDFSTANGGFQLWGDWWVIENIDIINTKDNVKGLQIAGNHNVIRNVNAYNCGDTGIQISGTSLEKYDKWPSFNLVEYCVSHDNRDPAENNADGFAAKLTVRDGNRFKNCIAYSNIDDGWDLFSKIESGPIGQVVIEDCIAYKNGSLSDGSGNGDGNGFKLGGDGIAIEHILRNSLAYQNGKNGITSNSNPAIILENVTSVMNGEKNIALYGKGSAELTFKTSGVLSIEGGSADEIPKKLLSNTNYFFDGALSKNLEGKTFNSSVFINSDLSLIPTIKNKKLNTFNLFNIKDSQVKAGARL